MCERMKPFMRARLTLILLLLTNVTLARQSPNASGTYTYKAREIRKSDVWINSAPLSLKALKGKVVVIDFWAFDCAPCIETTPHIVDLYNKYTKDGLAIIGVHTPRADYEKDVVKLRKVVSEMGIKYPVVVDDKEKIFRDYLCDLWPTLFVIDRDGIVQYSHGGVGRYEDIEKVVQELLSRK